MTEAATISATSVGVKGAKQFQGLFSVIPFKSNIVEASIASAATSEGDIAVPGAEVGDLVIVTLVGDNVGLGVSAFVTAADVVTIRVSNLTGGASTTLATAGLPVKGVVLKPSENVFAQL